MHCFEEHSSVIFVGNPESRIASQQKRKRPLMIADDQIGILNFRAIMPPCRSIPQRKCTKNFFLRVNVGPSIHRNRYVGHLVNQEPSPREFVEHRPLQMIALDKIRRAQGIILRHLPQQFLR